MAVKTISLIKGSRNIQITCQFVDVNTKLPFPLNGFVGATGYFPPLDTTVSSIPVVGSLVSSDLGEVAFVITADNLNSMAEGDELDWEQEVDLGSKGFVSQILANLSIKSREFPPS